MLCNLNLVQLPVSIGTTGFS